MTKQNYTDVVYITGSTRYIGVNVAGSTVLFNDALELLGVTLDLSLSFDKHVTNIVCACTFHTRALQHIRLLLTLEAAKAVAVSIVGSRLDYCNSRLLWHY